MLVPLSVVLLDVINTCSAVKGIKQIHIKWYISVIKVNDNKLYFLESDTYEYSEGLSKL